MCAGICNNSLRYVVKKVRGLVAPSELKYRHSMQIVCISQDNCTSPAIPKSSAIRKSEESIIASMSEAGALYPPAAACILGLEVLPNIRLSR